MMKQGLQYPISNNQCPSSKGSRQTSRGFTLIEVLAAMAVLVILVLALTRMFVESSGIIRRGTTTLMRNSTGETVMETILKDTESMVVNERLPCYIQANAVDPDGFGFDQVYFLTTSGDQDDDRAYQLRRYYVEMRVATNTLGVPYKRYQLFRDVWILAVADDEYPSGGKIPVDVLSGAKWWRSAGTWGTESILLADNVVRFDIYALGWDGEDWMNANAGRHEFDSTVGPRFPGGDQYKNLPPAAFDIYLQITSPEAAVEGGMALVDGMDVAMQQKGREMMIRESSSLFGRASPVMGAAQYHHPTQHYTDP